MSTRAAIARPNGESESGAPRFKGRYHHWDGYPSGLGATLFEIYRSVFDRDIEAMLKMLLDKHPAGWSTINGADWSLPAAPRDHFMELCKVCGEPNWKHYAQNYEPYGLPRPETQPDDPYGVQVFDHAYEHDFDRAHGPQCYCHDAEGKRTKEHEPAWLVTEKNAAGSGVEWVYVLDAEKRTMAVLSSYVGDAKMIGMFGAGDPNADWHTIAVVDLDGPEPAWDQIGP